MWVDGVVEKPAHCLNCLKPYCNLCLRIFWSVLEEVIKLTILMLTSMTMMMMKEMLNLTEPKMREPTEHPGPIGGLLSPVLSALSS